MTVSQTLPCVRTPGKQATKWILGVIVLDREERWFERGVREAIWEQMEQPSLGGRGGAQILAF